VCDPGAMATQVAAAAIVRHGRVLAARRTHPADVAGGWELPGGKVHRGESPAQAVVREVGEELGCRVAVASQLAGQTPIKPGYQLTAYLARLEAGEPTPLEHDAIRWLGPEELTSVAWLPADRPFLAELRELLLDGDQLPGGNVGGAARIGATVRRGTGAWTPAVHGLLAHLVRAGLVEVPRVHGFDDRGREVLDFLPGRVLDLDREVASVALLADAMRWLRRFHDVGVQGAGPDVTGPWRYAGRLGLGADEVMCHNDFAPYNVAVSTSADGDRVVGVFDWDLASPGTVIDDLAFAAWNWVPLWRPHEPGLAAQRLDVMAGAYGGVRAEDILAATVPRIEELVAFIEQGQAAGDPGMANLAAVGEPQRTVDSLGDLRLRVSGIRAALSA
jgi:8-oxo-dGTP diphosphatase